MITKDLQIALIEHYTKAIDLIDKEDGIHEIDTIMHEMKIEAGICSCSKEIFKIDLYNEPWIQDQIPKDDPALSAGGYWYPIPRGAQTVEQIIERLQFRVDKLKQILENEKDTMDKLI